MSASKLACVMVILGGCTTINLDDDTRDGNDASPSGAAPEGAAADAATVRCAVGDDVSTDLPALGIHVTSPVPPRATGSLFEGVNLDARASMPARVWDLNSPATTSNFPSSLTVYDSLGNGHQLTTYFTKVGPLTWDWHTVADGSEVVGGSRGVPFEGASGTLVFNADGTLKNESFNVSVWNFVGAAPAQNIQFNFGTSLDEHGTGLDGTTNFANSFTTNSALQDGYAAGSLTSARVDASGNIQGTYTNGQMRALGHCP